MQHLFSWIELLMQHRSVPNVFSPGLSTSALWKGLLAWPQVQLDNTCTSHFETLFLKKRFSIWTFPIRIITIDRFTPLVQPHLHQSFWDIISEKTIFHLTFSNQNHHNRQIHTFRKNILKTSGVSPRLRACLGIRLRVCSRTRSTPQGYTYRWLCVSGV